MKLFYLKLSVTLCLVFLSTIPLYAQIPELWGNTYKHGPQGGGSVFKVDEDGSNLQVVKAFNAGSPEGFDARGVFAASNKKIYGLTERGGLNGAGTLFMIDPDTNQFFKLHDFIGNSEGSNPISGLMEVDGVLYGTLALGGPSGGGSIFRYNIQNNSFEIVHHFNNSDGRSPRCTLMIASNGLIYGTTVEGGLYGLGTLFSLNPSTLQFLAVAHFQGNSGFNSHSDLVEFNERLFGTTRLGGNQNAGTIFEYDISAIPLGPRFNVRHHFVPFNGANPFGGLVKKPKDNLSDPDILLGLTYNGGIAGYGVVYEFDANTFAFAKRADFNGGNGAKPVRNLTFSTDGHFYTTTYEGGVYGTGGLLRYNYRDFSLVPVISFHPNTIGRLSNESLTLLDVNSVPPITPDLTTLSDITAQCEVTPAAPTANAGTITAVTNSSFPLRAQGTTVIKWTYYDGDGNATSQTQNVIIEDTTPPEMVCQPVIFSNEAGLCESNLVIEPPVVTDNCIVTSKTALDFDGQNDFVNLNSVASTMAGTTVFTIEFWVNAANIYDNVQGGLFAVNNSTGGNHLLFMTGAGTNNLITIYDAVSGNHEITGPTISDNSWHHVAYVRNGSSAELFVDGASFGTHTPNYAFASNDLWSFGQEYDGGKHASDFINGMFDDVRIWNMARTQEQIQQLSNEYLSGNEENLVLAYDFEDGVGSNTLKDISGNGNMGILTNMDVSTDWITSTAPIEPYILINNLTNNITGTSDASGVYPVGDTDVVWTVTDAYGNSNTCTQTITVEDNEVPAVITKNITVELDASGQVSITPQDIDNGSNDNCGIQTISLDKTSFDCSDIVNQPSYAASFTSGQDFVLIGDTASLSVNSQVSMEAWIYPSGSGSSPLGGTIINKEGEYVIARFPDGTIQWGIANTNPGWRFINSGGIAPLNQWTHIAFTYDGSLAKTFVNGTLINSIPANGLINDAFLPDSNFRIGGRHSSVNQYFEGNIDEVRVWNVALSETEVGQQYNTKLLGNELGLIGYWNFDEGVGNSTVDITSNGNNGAFINQTNWVTDSPNIASGIPVTLTVTDISGNQSSSIANVIITVPVDADGDGYTICDGDCDDTDDTINPGVTEIPNNGVDDDCNPATLDKLDIAWTGAINSDWTTAGNWENDNAPGLTPNIDVTIPSGAANYPILTSGQDLNVDSGLSVTIESGASLNINPTVVVTNNGAVTIDGSMTFESNASGSAYIGSGSGTFTGDVTIERYIPARRAYRQLSTPVTTSTFISGNWQQGTHITGSSSGANGFDATNTGNPSMYSFDNDAYNYVAMANTDATNLVAGQGYHTLVRGDRTTDLTINAPTPTATTLVSTGTLVAENSGSSTVGLTVPEQRFVFVGNPFQAPVDMWNVLTTGTTNIVPTFYWVWDPTLNTRGAYATVFAANGAASAGNANQYLQAGQACWIYTAGAGATTLSFTQGSKNTSVAETSVFKVASTKASTGQLRLSLYESAALAANQSAADGLLVFFEDDGNNAIDSNDASKFSNLDETFATSNGGTLLGIESRATPINAEEIQLNISTYRHTNYTIVAEGTAMQGATPSLFDAYTNTSTEIPKSGSVNYEYSIDMNDAASMAGDRFKIVYSSGVLSTENNTIDQIALYPNPTNTGQFYLNIPQNMGDLEVTIYNALGSKLFYKTGFTAGSKAIIKTSFTTAQGVYFVALSSNGNTTTRKLIIN
jgi:uncharacterized repeat protein (TIGR03803 family)